jgi:hypothetical protein
MLFDPIAPSAGDTIHPDALMMRVAASPSSAMDTVARVPQQDRYWYIKRPDGGTSVALQPFHSQLLTAASPNSQEFILVDRGQRPTGAATTVEVRRINLSSRAVRVQRVQLPAEPLSGTVVDSLVNARAASARRNLAGAYPSDDAARAAYRAGLRVPSHLPPVQRVVAGSDGSVWLQRFNRDEWFVVNNAGLIVRVVILPSRTAAGVSAVTLTEAWVAGTTTDGEPQLTRYRVR